MLVQFQRPAVDPLWREMSALFDVFAGPTQGRVRHAGPVATVREDESGWSLLIDVPGVAADQVEVQVVRDRLEVRAERKVDTPEGYNVQHRERGGWSLSRSWALPEEVDRDSVSASIDDGLLRITLPRRAELGPHRIPITVA